jgi:hypothetical protein
MFEAVNGKMMQAAKVIFCGFHKGWILKRKIESEEG